MKRQIFLLGIVLSTLLALNKNAFCQQTAQNTISLTEFDSRVDRAVDLLQTKPLRMISDTDQINIIKCLNTIAQTRERAFVNAPRFKGERYEKLEWAKDRKDYERGMMKIYTEYSQRNGMGIYFKKLDIELYGQPSLTSVFTVANQ